MALIISQSAIAEDCPDFSVPAYDVSVYYSSAAGKTGSSLKSALHSIISNHTCFPYTKPSNNDFYDGEDIDAWEALVYTDSACQDGDPKCGKVCLLYLGETRTIAQKRGKIGKGEKISPDAWEREHVWPKSRGFPEEADVGYTDLHHLRPADTNLNNAHDNYGYGEGGTAVKDKRNNGTAVDSGAKIDTTKGSFEPPDRAKGQVARMIFYMAVRYEAKDKDGMPDLRVRKGNEKVKESWIGDLCILVNWNNTFPPTDFERRRNNRVMDLQKNRNPFIDHYKWVDEIWGEQCEDSTTKD